jgi:hypothetical protein
MFLICSDMAVGMMIAAFFSVFKLGNGGLHEGQTLAFQKKRFKTKLF